MHAQRCPAGPRVYDTTTIAKNTRYSRRDAESCIQKVIENSGNYALLHNTFSHTSRCYLLHKKPLDAVCSEHIPREKHPRPPRGPSALAKIFYTKPQMTSNGPRDTILDGDSRSCPPKNVASRHGGVNDCKTRRSTQHLGKFASYRTWSLTSDKNLVSGERKATTRRRHQLGSISITSYEKNQRK
jgi:poly(3-hydroxybutyrate) depolymerase